MRRHLNWIKCFLGFHYWLTPLPWHGTFAPAWKRCICCGKETFSDITLEEYREIVKKCFPK